MGALTPKLKQWSEYVFCTVDLPSSLLIASSVVFLEWQQLATTTAERQGLRLIIRRNIQTAETQSLINQALACDKSRLPPPLCNRLSATLPKWPGYDFTNSRKSPFQALLGSDHGNGIAYLLFQHVEQLGHETVERITVWNSADDLTGQFLQYNMLFVIDDA